MASAAFLAYWLGAGFALRLAVDGVTYMLSLFADMVKGLF